jgi:tRNA G18 (ribose-2'-O)-methylase SpoU
MKDKDISSRENPTFKSFSRLLRTTGIRKQERAFLAGSKAVQEVLRDFPDRCEGILWAQGEPGPPGPLPEGIRGFRLAPDLLRELDIHGTHQPILLVRAKALPIWVPGQYRQGCTLFVPFQDPANVGAVLRSAAAFGVDRAVLLKEAAHPFHPKSVRAAGSALFRVEMEAGPSIQEMVGGNLPIFALAPRGEDIGRFRFPESFGLLPGLEGPGLPGGLKVQATLAVPMARGTESLNAALATGIALYVWRSRTV